ncbi:MAG: thiamine-phosphate kinase [Gammaproteobacteria bacterium]
MALDEFALIDRYFGQSAIARDGEGVLLGIGDDGAILRPPPGEDLVVSIDTLIEGVHFPRDFPAYATGHRALAVNLSDLAAMGARPLWFTLALCLPAVDEHWLAGFAAGLSAIAARHGITLVGGDTTRGPLAITVQVHGAIEPGAALRRDGAREGDDVWVSGEPGLAALGLARWLAGEREAPAVPSRFSAPEPRIALGRALRGVASAAIDVSDGLLADAGHIGERSACLLELDADALPLGAALRDPGDPGRALALCLAGGDDYELCFTAAPGERARIAAIAEATGSPCTRIGRVLPGCGARCPGAPAGNAGYRHF